MVCCHVLHRVLYKPVCCSVDRPHPEQSLFGFVGCLQTCVLLSGQATSGTIPVWFCRMSTNLCVVQWTHPEQSLFGFVGCLQTCVLLSGQATSGTIPVLVLSDVYKPVCC